MRERFVGFRHTVHFLALFHCAAAAFGRFGELARQARTHGFFTTAACRIAQPAHCQRGAADGADFDRNLVIRTTNAAAFYFHHRLDVVDCRRENFQRILGRLFLDLLERAVNDAFGDRLLAGLHQHVDEFRNINARVLRIREDLAFGYLSTTWHMSSLLFCFMLRVCFYAAFGRLAPYFERLCLRSLTPAVSRLPRTMW